MAATISHHCDQLAAHPGQPEAQMKRLGLDEMHMDRFGSVLRALNHEAIPTYASHVRQYGHRHSSTIFSETFRDSGSVPCKIVDRPLCGSYHIVFTLEFDDGIKWMLKISANGHGSKFNSVASAALTSEARTMQLIKAETTIPVPAVYAFEQYSQSVLNVPFILMERIDGQPLYRKWFDDEIPKASLEHFRLKTLQSLAEAMAQLNKFNLTRGGALQFDTYGKPIGLRGAKVVDAVAMWNSGMASENKSQAGEDDADNHNQDNRQKEGHRNDARTDAEDQNANQDKNGKSDQDNTNDDVDDEEIICEKGPFECPRSAFLFNLDRPNAYSESDVYVKGCYKALRMFIDLALPSHNDNRRRFVLTHPDLDVQNVLVAEDGSLRGLIDWDGVASVPREIGCAQYPLWLMRDWVPYYYVYDIREKRTEEDAGYEESSPAELASYRALYAHFMEKEVERQTGGPDQVTTFGTLPKQEALLTRQSLVLRDLDLAASSPFLLTNILCHILFEIESVTEPEWKYLDQDMMSEDCSSDEESVDDDSISNSGLNSDIDKEELERNQTNETNEIASVSPKIEMQDIQARKAKLIEAEKARKKSNYLADKAAIKEEMKIWEDIALVVRVRGVSLEQLRTNQRKIANWVADSLQPDAEGGNDPVLESGLLRDVEAEEENKPEEVREKVKSKDVHRLAQPERNVHKAEPIIRAGSFPESKAHKLKSRKALSRRDAVTAASVRASIARGKEDELKSPIAGSSTSESQANSYLNSHDPTSKQEGFRKARNNVVTAKEDKLSPKLNHSGSSSNTPAQKIHTASNPVSVDRHNVSPKRDIPATRPIVQQTIIDQDNEAIRASTTLKLTPASQLQPKTEKDLHRVSETFDPLCSSGASCSRKNFPNRSRSEKGRGAVIRQDSEHGTDDPDGDRSDTGESYDSSNTSVDKGEVELSKIAKAREYEDDVSGASIISANGTPGDQSGNNGTDEGCGTNRMAKTSSHKHPTLSGKISKKNYCTKLGTRRISRSQCSGKSLEMSRTKHSTTARRAARARDEKGAADMKSRADCENGIHAKSEDDRHSDAPIEEDTRPFEDDGKFRSRNILNLLGMDELDELRLLRMQEGFLKLLERY